jgi:hypothetical protein
MPGVECDAPLFGKLAMSEKNIPDSVKARLKNKALAEGKDLSLVLTRYALERFLYRLSISKHVDNFLLKGALLFDLWFDVPLRATRDIDLLGFGLEDASYLIQVFHDLCAIEFDDGVRFDSTTIKTQEIRKESNYTGIRITLHSFIDSARCIVQVDIGYGDAVTPGPEFAQYPIILAEFPAPNLRVYPRYTVVAEKLEAIISLGMANSRLKDYFDIWVLLNNSELEKGILSKALMATLGRRKTQMPAALPLGLSEEFANDPRKNTQWLAFANKNKLSNIELPVLVRDLRVKLAFLFHS